MKIYTMPQNSPEWDEVRRGKMTASEATAIGNCGKGLETYCRRIVAEMITKPVSDGYTNKDLQRGKELEPIAITKYEMDYGCLVQRVGFVELNEFVGMSPDGLVEPDGLLELKARNDVIHLGLLLGDEVDSGVIWQVNMQMLVAGRKWCDIGSYNPNYPKKSLIIKRFYPDAKKQESLLRGFEMGEKMIRELLKNSNVREELGEIVLSEAKKIEPKKKLDLLNI